MLFRSVAELLVLQGELVDDADEGGDVGAELDEFLVLGGDPLHQLGDGGAEARFVAVVDTAFLDSVEQAGPPSAMLPVEDAAARMKPRASRNGRLWTAWASCSVVGLPILEERI